MDYKERLISSGIFKRVRESQYRCNCPFCGDRKGHMYVKIVMTDDSPVLYNCFKCNAHGKLNKKFLEYFGIDDIVIPKTSYRKKIEVSRASSSSNILTVTENEPIKDISTYIQSRVGHYPTISDLQTFQYIGNPIRYAKEYLDNDNVDVTKKLKDRYWFKMTNGNIVGRQNKDTNRNRWMKYQPSVSLQRKGIYILKLPFDSYKLINVYIAEGVMDVIGLYYNYIQDNNVYIATLGKNYVDGLHYLISMGIFGYSVNVKIFKDSDVSVNKIIIPEYVGKLFNKIDTYQNSIGHDYGVLPDQLDIEKIIL